ncbi:MAG TPA: DUF1670 domain-containing protein, partial [Bacillota bacterium]|nr:DUF1670 domain-containing protein [Bacillota bacterium]
AVAESEPAGKALHECKRIPVMLRFVGINDQAIASRSIAELRCERIRRITHDALEQGAVLNLDEIALILTSSLSTIVRDIRLMRKNGETVPTRGHNKDIGRSLDARVQIIRMYCEGIEPVVIAEKTCRSIEDVQRPIEKFKEARRLLEKKMPIEKIAQILKMSPRLLEIYIEIIAL